MTRYFPDHNEKRSRLARERSTVHNWKQKLKVRYYLALGNTTYGLIEGFIDNLVMETLKEAKRRGVDVVLNEYVDGK